MKYLATLLAITLLFNCSNSDNGSEEEAQFCGIYEGDIFLPSDDAIREFGKCNYTEITGYLSIGESSYAFTITDLSPLSSISKVGGALLLHSLRELNNLNGLHNIESATRLSIAYAEALENLDDLDKLQTRDIALSNNYALQNIDGLDMESDTIGTIGIINSPLLTNLNCFSNIKTISNAFSIEGCDSLIDLGGLNNVKSIGELYSSSCCGALVIKDNFLMESIDGLEKLTFLGGPLNIRNNTYLENLDGLKNLVYLHGDIDIYDNSLLRRFCGLQNLFLTNGQVNGDFNVYNNYNNPTQTMIMNAPACD